MAITECVECKFKSVELKCSRHTQWSPANLLYTPHFS